MTLYVLFAGLLLLFVGRAPVALRRPEARPAWIAAGLGLLALLSIGVVVPMPTADAVLGGQNLLFLLRTVLPVVALWFFRDAVSLQSGGRRHGHLLVLAGMVAAQVIAFAFIPRSAPTEVKFVDHHMTTVAGLIWAAIYVAEVAWIVGQVAVMLWPVRRGIFAVFIVGATAVALGSAALLVHCALICARVVAPASGDAAWIAFNVFFYPGLGVMVLGFVVVTARDALSAGRWRIRAARLQRISRAVSGEPAPSIALSALRSASAPGGLPAAYSEAIRLRNLEYAGQVTLNHRQEATLRQVEAQLEALTFGTAAK